MFYHPVKIDQILSKWKHIWYSYSVEYHGEDCENIPNIKAEVCSDDEWIIIKLIDAGSIIICFGSYKGNEVAGFFVFSQ